MLRRHSLIQPTFTEHLEGAGLGLRGDPVKEDRCEPALSQTLSVKGADVSILGFVVHIVSVATIQLSVCNMKATWMGDITLAKLYLWTLGLGLLRF